jgi:type IV pilus assembly protein PilX
MTRTNSIAATGKKKSVHQQGVALIFVLLILVVVSLLGVGGAQLAIMGERGARNERDSQVARQSAEAALIDAEFDMRGPGTSPRKDLFNSQMNFSADCGKTDTLRGLCEQNLSGKPIWLTVDFFDTTASRQYATYGEKTTRDMAVGYGIQPALAPRYIVEVIPDSSIGVARGLKTPKKILHRVTAMGFGPTQNTQTVLQMVFRK